LGLAQKKSRPTSRRFRVEKVERGCETNTAEYNGEPGSFAIAVERLFSDRPDWHQDECAQATVQQYLNALDSAVAGRPEVQRYVACCVFCGIRFLADYRNPNRSDLLCPFGCQRCHGHDASNRRIARYRQSSRGKRTKHDLNVKYYATHRRRTTGVDGQPDRCCPTPPADKSSPDEPPATIALSPGGVVLSELEVARSSMIPYVQRLFHLIDGVRMTCDEVVCLLQTTLRQRGMGRRSRIAYALAFLHQHPP
jgi:hypothetical protein